MITINSNALSVLAFKAKGKLPLRIFPGYNNVDCTVEELGAYFKGNAAAEAKRKDHLTMADLKKLSGNERSLAEAAREKNENLNRAKKIIKQNKKELGEKDKTIKSQADVIKDLTARLEKLEKAETEPDPKSKKGKGKE